jgi:uncharacterized membrane protein YtjA (UPF0391 family)
VLLTNDERPPDSGQAERGSPATQRQHKEAAMLGWSLTFLILALVAGLLGFAGLAGAAAGIAKILFYVFLVLLVISFLARAMRGQSPV